MENQCRRAEISMSSSRKKKPNKTHEKPLIFLITQTNWILNKITFLKQHTNSRRNYAVWKKNGGSSRFWFTFNLRIDNFVFIFLSSSASSIAFCCCYNSSDGQFQLFSSSRWLLFIANLTSDRQSLVAVMEHSPQWLMGSFKRASMRLALSIVNQYFHTNYG